jgi:hypothetical protein
MIPYSVPRRQPDVHRRAHPLNPTGVHLLGDLDPTYRDYPHIEPGIYLAFCNSARWYRDRDYKRWICLIKFNIFEPDLMTPVASGIPLWLNGGSDAKPHAGRRSRYFREWIRANGGPPERTGAHVSECIYQSLDESGDR